MEESLWGKFKKIWSVPRYRALIYLGMYTLFFIFVFMFINSNQTEKSVQPKPIKTAIEKYSEMTNYEFDFQLKKETNEINPKINKDINNNLVVFGGKTKDNVTIINNKYFLKNNTIYEIIDEQIKVLPATLVDINIFKLKPDNISKLINLGELNYETKFKDGSLEKSYLVPLKDVVKNFKGEEIVDPKKSIEIKYKEKDKVINEVVLDLSNYQNYINKNNNSYIIKINYKNIGNVEDFKTDYLIIK